MFIRQMKVFLICVVLLLIVVFSQFALAETTITWRMGSWWKDAAPVIVEKFEEENPDIKVEVELLPFVGQFEASLIAAIGPQPPDVLAVDTAVGDMQALVDKELLEVLDPYIEKTGMDANDFFSSAWKMGEVKGKMFGIPFRIAPSALFYNGKMFKEAGLDPDNPPKNFDEILEYAKKMTNKKEGKYGFLIPASSRTIEPLHFVFYGVMRAF